MERLCERPGCSEPASVGYGMIPEDLVFWLDASSVASGSGYGMLCRRHADSMVVPRGWTLDDRRDPDLHLFRPPAAREVVRPQRARRASATGDAEQLRLDAPLLPPPVPPPPGPAPAPVPAAESDVHQEWTPRFDTDDDLDGLLSAQSPLLSRAFRGADRPRS